ncbi:glycosyltransferase [Sphingomicrobium nitratireducens]|uniref:glycosyltransferase n=1 Tax=Sphingomicrobium nitratireducens TaxID=2964666 RepID=UPI00223F0E9F|nr:glycosyltransferase [Sphingomicrobium nitratireducens]
MASPNLSPAADERAFVAELSEALEQARNVAGAKTALDRYGATAAASDLFDIRLIHLQLMEKAGLGEETGPGWAALYAERPDDPVVVRYKVVSLYRVRDFDKAMAIIERACPEIGDEQQDRLSRHFRAKLLDDIKLHDEAFALFRELVDHYPAEPRFRVDYAKSLVKLGRLKEAVELCEAAIGPLGEEGEALFEDSKVKLSCLERVLPAERDLHGEDCRLIALELVLRTFEGRSVAPGKGPRKVAMITGTLGAGGAERQLTKLTRLMKDVGGNDFEVIVRSHESKLKASDFFLPVLEEADIPVRQVDRMKPVHADRQVAMGEDEAILYSMLPPAVHFGLNRLAPVLRDGEFDVASIWQDGAVLFAGLAALFAGVGQVQLVFRGLPPNIRRERNRAEYPVLFKGLAKIPGVRFVTNSHVVAREYAAWLGLPEAEIDVLYNAVSPCIQEATTLDQAKWADFEARTGTDAVTIGGVFRLESDKQPIRWLKMAKMLLSERPDARFVIVGDGRLRKKVEDYARANGIADRLLLVGHSKSVGYWYDKMDVKVLLSRYEGLPNVLIEAQSVGTPVVSTPAGGAAECFLEGETGHILGCAENPDLEEACARVLAILERFARDPGRADRAREFVRTSFSDRRAVEVFGGLLASGVPAATRQGV